MAIKLDKARIRSLTITMNSANPALTFSRESYNYIVAPKNGTIAFSPGSTTADGATNGAGARLAITYDAVIPGQNNNIINLGSSSYKWKNVYATTFTGALSGNATTATSFSSARTIALTGDVTGSASSNGASGWSIATVVGDDTHNHTYNTVNLCGSYTTATAPSSIPNAITYVELPSTAVSTGDPTYGAMLTVKMSNNRGFSIGASGSAIVYRNYHSSSYGDVGYSNWIPILTSNNYTSYTVTKTGSGASGTWGISISGNAATATALTSNAGSSSLPIYFTGGKPSAVTNIEIKATDTTSKSIKVTNSNGSVGIHTSTNQGLYDFIKSSWIIYRPTGTSSTYIPAWASIGSAYVPTYHGANGVPTAVTANSVITNLASTSGASIFAASPRPGVTGTLPVANGGTGATSRSGAWTNIVAAGGTFTGSITISHATTATMDSTTTNPRIVFSESGSQPVGLVYTDYDSYRSPAGLKVLDMSGSNGNVWFEVTGEIIAGTKVTAPSFAGALTGNATTATTLANSRSLKISSTPGTTGTSFNGSADVTLIIPSTVKTFTELGTNKISSTAALYITPASTLYLDSAASTSILFRPQGTEKARFNASGDFLIKTAMYPGTNNTYNLGTSSSKWANVYATTFNGALSGNATTASTWATARTLTLAGDLAGSVSIKGNADMTLTATNYNCSVSSNNTSSYPYHRIAYIANKNGTYTDVDCILDIRKNYDNSSFGRLKISFRSNASGAAVSCHAYWIYRSGFAADDITIAWWGVTGNACYADVFLKTTTWARTSVSQPYGSRSWTLVSSSEGTDAANPVEAYTTVAAAGTALHSQAYTSTAAATDTGIVNYANSAGSVAWGNVTGKPSSYTPASHTHSYAGSSSAGGAANSANVLNINNTASLSNCLQYIQTSSQTTGNDLPTAAWWHVLKMNHGTGDTYYKRLLAFNFFSNEIKTSYASGDGTVNAWKKVWVEGDSVTGAVWNDYAEYRESDCKEFGRVLTEKGDDTLTKTTKRLEPFAGVSSDTWGFCQGETEKAKTPIAVAGRVLVYTWRNRNEYKPGDCVCAAPNGTVDIMTREEIIKYPDRIVGTVSCVPEYETWGSGDRDPVKVGNRIWIKVK